MEDAVHNLVGRIQFHLNLARIGADDKGLVWCERDRSEDDSEGENYEGFHGVPFRISTGSVATSATHSVCERLWSNSGWLGDARHPGGHAHRTGPNSKAERQCRVMCGMQGDGYSITGE